MNEEERAIRLEAIRDELISQLEISLSQMPLESGSRSVRISGMDENTVSSEWNLLELAQTWAILSDRREAASEQPEESDWEE